jgi:hypothetical protein
VRKEIKEYLYSDEYPDIPFTAWAHRVYADWKLKDGIWIDGTLPLNSRYFCMGTIMFHLEDFDPWNPCYRGSEYSTSAGYLGWHSGPIFYTLLEVKVYLIENAECKDLDFYLWGKKYYD